MNRKSRSSRGKRTKKRDHQMNSSLSKLAEGAISSGRITPEEVKALRRGIFSEEQIAGHMFDEGMVDRDEAELLFRINDAVCDGTSDHSWSDLFVEAVTSHVLKDEMSAGALDEEEARFLIARIEKDGKIDAAELELLVNISATVATAPDFFQEFVRQALQEQVARAGVVDERSARFIRRVLFGTGSSSGTAVDELEKAWVHAIEATVKNRSNHFSWQILKHELGIS